ALAGVHAVPAKNVHGRGGPAPVAVLLGDLVDAQVLVAAAGHGHGGKGGQCEYCRQATEKVHGGDPHRRQWVMAMFCLTASRRPGTSSAPAGRLEASRCRLARAACNGT